MILTDEERTKFAQYCRSMADSARLIREQMEKSSLMPDGIREVMTKVERAKEVAYSLVARDLSSAETQVIN